MINYPFKNSGSSMIEVMVALLVMAVGLLGILAMQTKAMQFNQNAYLYSQAALLANDIIEPMRGSSNPDDYLMDFDDAAGAAPACTGTAANCSSSDMADWYKANWRASVESSLPGGESAIEVVGGVYAISVRFHTGYDAVTGTSQTDVVRIFTSF